MFLCRLKIAIMVGSIYKIILKVIHAIATAVNDSIAGNSILSKMLSSSSMVLYFAVKSHLRVPLPLCHSGKFPN